MFVFAPAQGSCPFRMPFSGHRLWTRRLDKITGGLSKLVHARTSFGRLGKRVTNHCGRGLLSYTVRRALYPSLFSAHSNFACS